MQAPGTNKLKRHAGLIVALSGGMLAGFSCSGDSVRAIVAGLDAVANELTAADDRDDVSFSDWLDSELNDL